MPDYICNLIIPGAARSGTTSLHTALNQHPEIAMSSPKEPQFFSFDDRFTRGADEHNSIFRPRNRIKYYGESSQCYFAHPHAIERIRQTLEAPKIIIMVRHPITRLLSQYKWNYKRGTETGSLKEAVYERGEIVDYIFDDRLNTYREQGGYTAFSRYSKWIPHWQKAFGAENVLILKFENFTRDPHGSIKSCIEFLGLNHSDLNYYHNENTSEQTLRKILPQKYLSAACLIPKSLKRTEPYKALKKRVIRHLTPDLKGPPDTLSEQALSKILETEIRFYEQLFESA